MLSILMPRCSVLRCLLLDAVWISMTAVIEIRMFHARMLHVYAAPDVRLSLDSVLRWLVITRYSEFDARWSEFIFWYEICSRFHASLGLLIDIRIHGVTLLRHEYSRFRVRVSTPLSSGFGARYLDAQWILRCPELDTRLRSWIISRHWCFNFWLSNI